MIMSQNKKVYYVGDTGYCPVFSQIGKRYGPIDLAFIPVGAYEPRYVFFYFAGKITQMNGSLSIRK